MKKRFSLLMALVLICTIAEGIESEEFNMEKISEENINDKYDLTLSSAPENFKYEKDFELENVTNYKNYTEKNVEILLVRKSNKKMPTRGGEYPYQASFWNNDENIFRANYSVWGGYWIISRP